MSSKIFNIALPKELVKRADIAAKQEYRNRSELIREALRIYLAEIEDWNQLFSYSERQAARMRIKSQQDIDRITSEFRHGKNKSRS